MASKKEKTNKKIENIVKQVSELSVIELSDLVNTLQDKLGVSAMPAAAAVAPAQTTQEAAESGQQASEGGANQTLVMTDAGSNKIAVIKALREINQNLTLMDAKGMTENVPAEILKDAKAEDVKSAEKKLKAAGATIELK